MRIFDSLVKIAVFACVFRLYISNVHSCNTGGSMQQRVATMELHLLRWFDLSWKPAYANRLLILCCKDGDEKESCLARCNVTKTEDEAPCIDVCGTHERIISAHCPTPKKNTTLTMTDTKTPSSWHTITVAMTNFRPGLTPADHNATSRQGLTPADHDATTSRQGSTQADHNATTSRQG
ncbi:hypothetical protein DPMN_046476 [Dreissena polymorpha]|uniref:Secreted protein n=1 Tax=Dreissena polymorpha TaxID=45954 RepID=A0A9D4D9M9_DREPO|nr:hypothetical protein DPMN_046476 [Dreissena polymorpha]